MAKRWSFIFWCGTIQHERQLCRRNLCDELVEVLVLCVGLLPSFSRAALVSERINIGSFDEIHGVYGSSLGCRIPTEFKPWVEICSIGTVLAGIPT